ncbi:MAG: GntR family transcriptional regulator [Bacillota bacterium]
MPRRKFEDIADILRLRILTGQLMPGQDFPTTTELLREFGGTINTVQEAVRALIQEGLVITYGSGSRRRIVRPINQRTIRKGGFSTEFGDDTRVELIELDIINKPKGLPPTVLDLMKPPLLLYRTRQFRGEMPVALSVSYIPGTLPIKKLKDMLENPANELYQSMKSIGLKPCYCEESLIAAKTTAEEETALYGAAIVQRIKRKVFDPEGNLLELCFLTDRADCYEFVYQFPLFENNPDSNSNNTLQVDNPTTKYEQGLRLLENQEEKKNDIDYLCRLLDSNLIVLTDKGRPLTPEQKEGFIKFLRETPALFDNHEINYKDSPLAAHLEGQPDLKPELIQLLNISLILNLALEKYLRVRKEDTLK